MALVTCPDCNREVSDAAPACPGCGRPHGSTNSADAEAAPTEHAAAEKAANTEISLLALVTLLLVGARCFEIVHVADRVASATDKSADYEAAIKNLFFETAPPPFFGLTSALAYGGVWLGLVVVVLAITRARK